MKRTTQRTLAALGAVGLASSVVAWSGAAQAADPFTDPDSGTTSTYSVVDGFLTWPEARDAAAATAAPSGCSNHLVVITSQAEQDYVDAAIGEQGSHWIGAQRGESGDFQWVTGEPFVYTNWNSGEPNNTFPGEPYAQLTGGNRWNDIFANYVSGYVLETQCQKVTTPPKLQRAVVTSVSPSSGPSTGGTQVTITGQHFTGAKKVTFGGAPAASYTVVSDTEITATSPAGSLGPKNRPRPVYVRVQTVKTASASSAASRYTYVAPSNNT